MFSDGHVHIPLIPKCCLKEIWTLNIELHWIKLSTVKMRCCFVHLSIIYEIRLNSNHTTISWQPVHLFLLKCNKALPTNNSTFLVIHPVQNFKYLTPLPSAKQQRVQQSNWYNRPTSVIPFSATVRRRNPFEVSICLACFDEFNDMPQGTCFYIKSQGHNYLGTCNEPGSLIVDEKSW